MIFETVVDDYINYYNNKRIKEKTDCLSPIEFMVKCGFNT